MHRPLAAALTAVAVSWLALLLLAPVLSPGLALVYEFASRICHQRPERSFQFAGMQLPVCARCFGLYASGAIAALVAWMSNRTGWNQRPYRTTDAKTARIVLGAAAAPTLITIGAEWLGLANPSNIVRAATALPLGGAAGWLFVHMLFVDAGARARRTASAAK